MADNDDSKDKLRIMGLISEGRTKVDELVASLDWTRERVEETVDELRDSDYVKKAEKGGEQVLEITDRGREQLPQLLREVADETQAFVDSLAETFQKHFDRVFPKVRVNVDVDVDQPDDE